MNLGEISINPELSDEISYLKKINPASEKRHLGIIELKVFERKTFFSTFVQPNRKLHSKPGYLEQIYINPDFKFPESIKINP